MPSGEGVVRSAVRVHRAPALLDTCYGAHHLGLEVKGLPSYSELLVYLSAGVVSCFLLWPRVPSSVGPMDDGPPALLSLVFVAQPIGPGVPWGP